MVRDGRGERENEDEEERRTDRKYKCWHLTKNEQEAGPNLQNGHIKCGIILMLCYLMLPTSFHHNEFLPKSSSLFVLNAANKYKLMVVSNPELNLV